MKNSYRCYVIYIIITVVIISAVNLTVISNNEMNSKKLSKNSTFAIPDISSNYNATFSSSKILWSYPVNGNQSYIIQSTNEFPLNIGVSGVLGANITGDGFADFIIPYAVKNNATLRAVDSNGGTIIWEDNFSNYMEYLMVGTIGKMPMIMVLTGNVTPPPYSFSFNGPGYVNISMVNGINGKTIWYRNNTLSDKEGMFYTPQDTVYVNGNPAITTYSLFYRNGLPNTNNNGEYNVTLYNVTIYAIKNINGVSLWMHNYDAYSIYIYLPPYLSLATVPGLRCGGVYYKYTYFKNNIMYTNDVLLDADNGSIIWNVSSANPGLILTGGTSMEGTTALGNFDGGSLYNLAYPIISYSIIIKNGEYGLAYVNFGIEVINITDGKSIYSRLYGLDADTTVMQNMQSAYVTESLMNVDNATGGIGSTFDINGTAILVINIRNRSTTFENITAINIAKNKTLWKTELAEIPVYGITTLSYMKIDGKDTPVITVINILGSTYYIDGLNGTILSIIPPQPRFHETANPWGYAYPIVLNITTLNNGYPDIAYITPNVKTSFGYNITVENDSNGNVIGTRTINISLPPIKNATYNTSYYVLPTYFASKIYIEASFSLNYKNNWTNYVYVINPANMGIVQKDVINMTGMNPDAMYSLPLSVFKAMYRSNAIKYFTTNLNIITFAIQTNNRFYAMEYIPPKNLTVNLTETGTTGIVPFTENFYANSSGGISPYNYTWYENGKVIPIYNNESIIYFNTSGIYNISVKVTDESMNVAFSNVTIYAKNKTVMIYTYTLNGTVTDVNGTPIGGVNVSVNNTKYVYTNGNGVFSMNMTNGTYLIKFSKVGYVNETYPVSITGNNITLKIVLKSISNTTTNKSYGKSTKSSGLNELDIGIIFAVVLGVVLSIVYLFYPKKRRGLKR